jgi:DNA-binding NarL/FixJ family response regulator
MAEADASARRRVLIVDDHPVVRLGLKQLIEQEPDLEVCADASSTEAALEAAGTSKPHLAIIDLSLAGRNGLELLHEMHRLHPEVAVVVLSFHDEALYAERTLRAGARAYVMKSEPPDVLIGKLRDVLAGKIVVGARVAQRVLERLSPEGSSQPDRVAGLTDRELEVLEMVGRGSSTAQIAEKLGLSVKTVETYRSNIKSKLGLRDAAEFVRFATTWVETL